MKRISSVGDVAAHHLCSGCGACAFLSPRDIAMVDDLRQGRRPLALTPVSRVAPQRDAVEACPGRGLAHVAPLPKEHLRGVGRAWGPVLELWEGWATDDEIRHRGSSGGAATALALHCLTAGGMEGVLHTAARADVPYLNETVLSRSRDELVARTGSRYAPASPCDGLQQIADADAACVFIGKPCDVAGAVRSAELRPQLRERLGLTIAIFCAGTPTTAGTLEAVRTLGLDPARLRSVRYRGHGWPGRFRAEDVDGRIGSLSYEESWGAILQRHRQWRCMVCADHTGEFADISVGDPWYQPTGEDPGRSLVVVRTERGRQIVRAALAAGVLELRQVEAHVLADSQPNLVTTRGAVWGRILTMRLLGLRAPRYRRMPMFRSWTALTPKAKAQSTFGTARRIVARRLYRRDVVDTATAVSDPPGCRSLDSAGHRVNGP